MVLRQPLRVPNLNRAPLNILGYIVETLRYLRQHGG
jgi:hypothetical protein